MDVSVVIPTYNRADLLPLTLDAVLSQSVPPREVIVVDDGSEDDTLAVACRHESRVRVIRIENSGSIVARNVGLRAAVAPLVAFCDSDDLWAGNFLELMTAAMRREPRTKLTFSNFRVVREGVWSATSKFDEAPTGYWHGLRMVDDGVGFFDQPIVDRVVRWQPFFPSALMVNRMAMLQAGGWDEGVGRTVGDDFGTALRLAEWHPFGVVFAPLVGICKHAGNFSASVRAMNLGDANILDHVLASRPSLAPLASLLRTSAARRRRDALDSAFADGDFAAVLAIYRLLPDSAGFDRIKLKRLISGLPSPLANTTARLLRQVASARD